VTISGSEDTSLLATQPLSQPFSENATHDPTLNLDDQHTSSSSSSESGSGNENGENGESSCSGANDASSSTSSSSYSFGSSFEEDILHIFGPECSYAPAPSSMKTYKLTGDNLDKNVKPTEYRIDSQTKSLHYFQTYAVRDRIDLTSYDDTPPVLDESSINTKMMLPSESDYKKLTKNFSQHVVRILKEYMPFFSSFGSGLERHIRHKYYEEMSQKSEVVSFPLNYVLVT
jgi:L1 cell adhesion molecule like protein